MRATSSPFSDLFDSVDVKLPREEKLMFHAAFLFTSHFNCSPSFYEGKLSDTVTPDKWFSPMSIQHFLTVNSMQFKVRVKKAFNTEIIFPIVITTVPPSAEPSVDPVLREHIYIALANYLASRAAAELDNDAQEATEGERNTVWDGSPAPEANRK